MRTPGYIFIKIDNGFPEHRKTIELSDRAFRRLIEVWCLCSRQRNDGSLSDAQVSQLFTRKVRDELVKVGYLERGPDGWVMHEYTEHQHSAADIADLREKRRAAGKRGGEAKAKALALASDLPEQTPTKDVPDRDRDRDRDKELLKTPSSAPPKDSETPPKYPAEFEAFWRHYPRKVGKDHALKAWITAKKRATPEAITAGAERMAADPNLPEPGFIPHPTTWLARGGWNDEPFPARPTPDRRPDAPRVFVGANGRKAYA